MDWERVLLLFKVMEHTRQHPDLKYLHDAAYQEVRQHEASLHELPDAEPVTEADIEQSAQEHKAAQSGIRRRI